jgi:L1 cell adhesion molecule like protein
VDIYEGERYKTKDNNLLGSFDLTGIAPAPRGIPQIEITYELDANGILNVTAKDKANPDVHNAITISNDAGRLSQDDIDRMIADAEEFKSADRAEKETHAACEATKAYIYQVMDSIESAAAIAGVTSSDLEQTEQVCVDAMEWMEQNQEANKQQFEKKRKEVEAGAKNLMTKIYQAKLADATKEKAKGRRGARR